VVEKMPRPKRRRGKPCRHAAFIANVLQKKVLASIAARMVELRALATFPCTSMTLASASTARLAVGFMRLASVERQARQTLMLACSGSQGEPHILGLCLQAILASGSFITQGLSFVGLTLAEAGARRKLDVTPLET